MTAGAAVWRGPRPGHELLIFGGGQVPVGRLLPHGDALVQVVMAFGKFGMAITGPIYPP